MMTCCIPTARAAAKAVELIRASTTRRTVLAWALALSALTFPSSRLDPTIRDFLPFDSIDRCCPRRFLGIGMIFPSRESITRPASQHEDGPAKATQRHSEATTRRWLSWTHKSARSLNALARGNGLRRSHDRDLHKRSRLSPGRARFLGKGFATR